MTATIDYDHHVKNLIDDLSETGHVYHTKYKKKSVTFHHNAGNLNFNDILRAWTFRRASAHFDVDIHGHVAQYVDAEEYAWAVGNTEGNKETISIEMANKNAAPHWEVDEVTWKAAARLAGWLFVHVIEDEPTHSTVLLHDHWSATDCPGPYVHSIYGKLLSEVQHWYRHFMKENEKQDKQSKQDKKDDTNAPEPHYTHSEKIIRTIQEALGGLKVDGRWGAKTDAAVLAFRKKHLNKF